MSEIKYVYACGAPSEALMTDMISEYVGCEMIAQIWDRGAIKSTRIRLMDVAGGECAFTVNGGWFGMPLNDVFGQGVTRVFV